MNRHICLFCVWTATKKITTLICKITNVLLIIAGSSCVYHLIFKVYWFVAGHLWVSNGKGYVQLYYMLKINFYDYSIFSSTCWMYRASILFSMYDCMIVRVSDRQKTKNFSFDNTCTRHTIPTFSHDQKKKQLSIFRLSCLSRIVNY